MSDMPKSEAYNMDCLAAMREMPDKAFSLAIVDPPYGIGMDGGKRHKKDYKKKRTGIIAYPTKSTLMSYSGYQRIR